MKLIRVKCKDALTFENVFANTPHVNSFVKELITDAERFSKNVERRIELFVNSKDLDKLQNILKDIEKTIEKQRQIIKSL